MADLFDLNINTELLNKYTLNPAAHLSEVDSAAYKYGRLYRSSLDTRCLDTFVILAGCFHGELFDDTGGQAGFLDFLIPHYFSHRLLSTIIDSNHQNIILDLLLILPVIIVGVTNLILSLLQKTIALALFLLSFPIILIVNAIFQPSYNEKKDLIKDLMISVKGGYTEFPLQEIINPALELDIDIDGVDKVADFDMGKIVTYKEIFSKSEMTTKLIQKGDNLYIKLTQSDTNKYYIRVDSDNPEPLKNALYLNIFGITRSLERSAKFGVTDLQYVENALAAPAA